MATGFAPIPNDEMRSKARTFRLISYIFGLIVPGLMLIATLFFAFIVRSANNGFGALGLAAVFSFSLVTLSFIAVPFGIVAIVYGVKARSLSKQSSLSKDSYVFAIIIGCLNVAIPTLFVPWFIFFGH